MTWTLFFHPPFSQAPLFPVLLCALDDLHTVAGGTQTLASGHSSGREAGTEVVDARRAIVI